MRLDKDDVNPDYDCDWIIETGDRKSLSEIYNEFFQKYPDLSWYGFIADDVVPKTYGWDWKLIQAAGMDNMACPDGKINHFVLGGNLVRETGWLSLPGLDRIYIDTVWEDIARKKKVLKILPEVKLEHHHFSNKRALFDNTYVKEHKERDHQIYRKWKELNRL